jgi:hypothetical protein
MPQINLQNVSNVTSNIQQYVPYINNGLTFVSDNPQIVPRTKEGVIKVEENKPLIIEPTRYRISNQSILKVVDTQFNYYNFPVSVNVVNEEIDITNDLFDPVFARYRPSENRRVLTEASPGKFNGILMDFIEDGNLQKDTNKYYISKELKNSGVDLRFRIKIEHRFDSAEGSVTTSTPDAQTQSTTLTTTNLSSDYGTVYFSIIKDSPVTGLNRNFKGEFANVATVPVVRNADNPPTVVPIPVNSTETPGAPFGYIGRYQVQTLSLDITILNSEFDIGDYFSIGAFSGQNSGEKNTDGIPYEYHTINANTSYWVISDASKNVDEWNQEL